MRIADLNGLALTLGAPLLIALLLLLMRVFVMGRAQEKRQRANRQQTERLKSLVSAYRALAGSFRPLGDAEPLEISDRGSIESALSDILLFGSTTQAALAAECARALVSGRVPPLTPLVTDLRIDLRKQLGLAPLDEALEIPASGPLRSGGRGREGRNGEGQHAEGARGGAGGGGMGGGLLMSSGASAGLHLGDEAADAIR